jgi:hypothetical protein
MRNAYKPKRRNPSTARAYLDLIRTTVHSPPTLSQVERRKMCAVLALPRVDERGPQPDLFKVE